MFGTFKLECMNEFSAQSVVTQFPNNSLRLGKAVLCWPASALQLGCMVKQGKSYVVRLTDDDIATISAARGE